MNEQLIDADGAMKKLGVSAEELEKLVAEGRLRKQVVDGEDRYAQNDVEWLALMGGTVKSAPDVSAPADGTVAWGGEDASGEASEASAAEAGGDQEDEPAPAEGPTPEELAPEGPEGEEPRAAADDEDPGRTLEFDGPVPESARATIDFESALPFDSAKEEEPPDSEATIQNEPSVPAAPPASEASGMQTIAQDHEPDDTDPLATIEFSSRASTRDPLLDSSAQMTIMNAWEGTLQLSEDLDPECTLKSPDEDFGDIDSTMEGYPTPHTIPHGGVGVSSWVGSDTASRIDLMVSGLPRSEISDMSATVAGGPGEDGEWDPGVTIEDLPRSSGAEFTIVRHLASGGMGDVYMAQQAGLDRIVAFKVPKLGEGREARKDLALFVREAAVTGELEHPNIVPIYKSGAGSDDKPFYAMKKVNGVEWRHLLRPTLVDPEKDPEAYRDLVKRSESMEFDDHLGILLKVCDAIAFAHSKGVMHRDLKPENVMVGDYGEVLVMDWGLAVDVTDRDPRDAKAAHVSTIKGSAGTPAYLAPEMALPDKIPLGKHSDIYLLGAILYELLTGGPPHRGKKLLEVIYAAAQNRLQMPRDRAPGRDIPQGLSDIAMKAMSTQPEDRYESAEAFQEAIREYQGHAQSLAISSAADEELKALGETASSMGSELYAKYAAIVASHRQAIRLWTDNEQAHIGLVRALEGFIQTALNNRDLGLAEAQIAELRQAEGHNEVSVARFDGELALLAAAEARTKRNLRIMQVTAAALVLLLIGGGVVFSIWQRKAATKAQGLAKAATDAKKVAEEREKEAKEQRDAAESANAKIAKQNEQIAAQMVEVQQQRDVAKNQTAKAKKAQEDAEIQRKAADEQRGFAEAREKEAKEQKKLASEAAEQAKRSLAQVFIDRAKGRVASDRDYGEAALRLVQALQQFEGSDAALGMLARVLRIAPRFVGYRGIEGGSRMVAFSYDGKSLAALSNNGTFQTFSLPSLDPLPGAAELGSRPWGVVSLANGDWLASLEDGRVVRLTLEPDGGVNVDDVARPFSVQATALAVSKGGEGGRSLMAVGASDGRVALFEDGKALSTFRAHRSGVSALRFAGPGHIVTASWDGLIKRWSLPGRLAKSEAGETMQVAAAPELASELKGHGEFIYGLDVTADGFTAVSAGADGTIRLWDLRRGLALQTLKAHEGAVGAVSFVGDDGHAFASQGWDGTVRLWDRAAGAVRASLRVSATEDLCVSVGPSGDRLACLARSGGLKVWDIRSRLDIAAHAAVAGRSARRVRLTNDGARLLVESDDGRLIWVDTKSGEVAGEAKAQAGALAMGPVAGGKAQLVLRSGEIRSCDMNGVSAKRFGLPSAPRLADFDDLGAFAAALSDSDLSIYEIGTGNRVAHCRIQAGDWPALAIAPDGSACAAIRNSRRAVVLDRQGTWTIELPSGAGPRAIVVGPGGKKVALGGDDRLIRVYECGDAQKGRLVETLRGHEGVIEALAVTADGQTLISGSRDRSVKLWDMASYSSWLSLPITEGWVSDVLLSADGSRFGAVSEQGVMRIWAMPSRGESRSTGLLMEEVRKHFALELVNGQPTTTTGQSPAAQRGGKEEPEARLPLVEIAEER